MRLQTLSVAIALFFVVAHAPGVNGQTSAAPPYVAVSGTFRPADGQPPAPVETVTLSLYATAEGGSPLWQESQAIAVDAEGRYTFALGATSDRGAPPAPFASGDAQWLSVQFTRPGEVEGPRIRIATVPYALKATDADTLGGRPASAYALAAPDSTASVASSDATSADRPTPKIVLTGTTNYVAKYLNTADVGNSAIYETNGSVGINTSTPADALHVRFTDPSGSMTGLAVQNLGNTATSYSGMLFYDQNGALGQFQGFNNATHEYRINNIATGGSINFMTGAISRFLITNGGDVGLGTSTPFGGLHMARNGPSAVVLGSHGPTGGNTLLGRRALGTESSPTVTPDGATLLSLAGSGYDMADWRIGGEIAIVAAQGWTELGQGTEIRFRTNPFGVPQALADRMVVTAFNTVNVLGSLGVGVAIPADRLQVIGDVRVGTAGTDGCVKRFDGTGIAGTCSSDVRLKRDVAPFGSVLSSMSLLQPVHYFWRSDEFPARHLGTGRTYGLIAQDVEAVLPELVSTDSDGFKAVDYAKLPLLTIQAMKELRAEKDALQERVDRLEALVASLTVKR